MFSNREGHIVDTESNRELVQNISNNKNNYLGVDKHGNQEYMQMQPNGSQVWVYVRDNIIQNCGQNIGDSIRTWVEGVGLIKP